MMPIVFWQNIPSIHQASLISALAQQHSGDVVVVVDSDISKARLAQGWGLPNFLPAKLIVSPTIQERDELIQKYAVEGSVHIFSGFNAFPGVYSSLKKVSRTPATIGIYAEPGEASKSIKSALRRMRYVGHALRWRRRLSFMLATGELGVKWYDNSGFPVTYIYPFGYFTGSPGGHKHEGMIYGHHQSNNDNIVHLVFVGSLDSNKGLDLLLHGLSSLCDRQWHLSVVGGGPLRKQLERLSHNLNISNNVSWIGVQPNDKVIESLLGADALVLPSRYDGWGAVVNEALSVGTRVVVSDGCGSSDLIRHPDLGQIFESGSVESLIKALRGAVEKGPLSAAERGAVRKWAEASISPAVAAKYFLEILDHVQRSGSRPCAPWRKK